VGVTAFGVVRARKKAQKMEPRKSTAKTHEAASPTAVVSAVHREDEIFCAHAAANLPTRYPRFSGGQLAA
jgi:hypothetical protein